MFVFLVSDWRFVENKVKINFEAAVMVGDEVGQKCDDRQQCLVLLLFLCGCSMVFLLHFLACEGRCHW